MKEQFVLKLGGSLLYNDDLKLNVDFLDKFVKWFGEATARYDRMIIVVGGGKVSRHLVDLSKRYNPSEEDQHRIGMAVTNTNAEVIGAILRDKLIKSPRTLGEAFEMVSDDNIRYVVSGGFKEGWSTDMDAAVLGHMLGVKKINKLSNIDHIYTSDPRKDPDARIMKDLTWNEYFSHFGITRDLTSTTPGVHTPIDAFCSNFAAEKGLSFMVSGGSTIVEKGDLWEVLQTGTLVHP